MPESPVTREERLARIEHDRALGSKECSRCKVRKPFSEYSSFSRAPLGVTSHCKACDKERRCAKKTRAGHLKRHYGLTPEEYTDQLVKRSGKCDICGLQETWPNADFTGEIRNLVVDHDHKTGQIRGLLCSKCNSGIGQLLDSEEIAASAAEYLRASRAKPEPQDPEPEPDEDPASKVCLGPCGESLPLEAFYKSPRGKYGRQSNCKSCQGEAQKGRDKESRKERSLYLAARNKQDEDTQTKECTVCGVRKPFAEFSPGTARFGLNSRCRPCVRGQWCSKKGHEYVLKRHGLTPEDYATMLAEQGGVCAICSKEETSKRSNTEGIRALAVDHNHETGMVRGLLCTWCNKGIGLLRDDETVVLSAAQYLKKWNSADA